MSNNILLKNNNNLNYYYEEAEKSLHAQVDFLVYADYFYSHVDFCRIPSFVWKGAKSNAGNSDVYYIWWSYSDDVFIGL